MCSFQVQRIIEVQLQVQLFRVALAMLIPRVNKVFTRSLIRLMLDYMLFNLEIIR